MDWQDMLHVTEGIAPFLVLPMELKDICLPNYSVDGGRPLHDKPRQRILYEAIQNGDLETFRSILRSSRANYDLDRLNSSGKTILQVAADLSDVSIRDDIITALLNEGASLQISLMNAVKHGNVREVKILLQFYNGQSQTAPQELHSVLEGHAGQVTPLILAALLGNFQIVKLLLEHGFTIEDPKTVRSSTDFTEAPGEKLGPAVYRLNGYRAVASPVLISASFLQNVQNGPDPVLRACVLSKELRDMAEREYEFRSEYLKLCDDCEEFTVSLLNECCTMEEIRCVLETKNEDKMVHSLETNSLNMLEFAIHVKTKKLVSHPYSQLVLNSEVYKNVSFLEAKSSRRQLVLALLASVLYPLAFVVWCVFESCFPKHKVTRMFHSPLMKFLMYFGSYQTFLFLLAFTSTTSNFLRGYSFTDIYIVIFIIGQLVDLVKDVLQKGRARFWSYYWNYLIAATVASFLLGHITWWIGRATLPDAYQSKTLEDKGMLRSYSIMLSSEGLISWGILLAFIQNFIFFQVNASIGPLLNAFTQMLTDVAKFLLYFAFVFLAFAASFTKLYAQYNAAMEFFALPTYKTKHQQLERLDGSANVIFWSLFGEINRDEFRINEKGFDTIWKTGITLFGVFNVVAVLVALNMLIAILNESYTRISENLDTEWKFTRTKTWLNWIYKKSLIPPPLSILYVLLPVFWVIERLSKAYCPQTMIFLKRLIRRKPISTRKVKKIDETKRRGVIRHLVLRYLAKKSCCSDIENEPSGPEEEPDSDATTATAEPILENATVTMKVTGL